MFYSSHKKQLQTLNRRTFFLLATKIGLFSIVASRLFKIQIINSKKYETLSKNNQINVEILYPQRGLIKERSGMIIASNNKVFDLYIVPELTEDLLGTLNNLSNFIKIDFQKKRDILKLSKKLKNFEKIKIVENLDWNTLEKLEANKNYLAGLKLVEDFQRIYPEGIFYSHILGYVNMPSKKDLKLPYISKMPKLNIGQQGIEKYFNESLVGKPGSREIEVNSSGRIIREISKTFSTRGNDIKLSLDSRIQKFVFDKLSKHKAGSIVVMDINSGEVLSMASHPNFDSNLIIKKPNKKYWNSLLENKLSPLTDRSIQGLYSPGSTFKLIVAIAALHHGILNPKDEVFCNGKINFGDSIFHCWKTKGHGIMDINSAIKESCDVFFYNLSIKIGINKIAKVANDFGLGQIYPINIPNQKKGIIPSKKWKEDTLNQSWYGGETLIAAIGQGYVLCTPFQLAVMTSRIASGGKKVIPSVLKTDNKKEFELMNKYSNSLKIVNKAMFDVVNKNKGTANKSKSKNFNYSGKTGTSQVKKISLAERESASFRNIEIEWKNRDHALFVGYMPTKFPKYAISIVIEHGGSGAAIAAPIAKDVFEYMNEIKII